MKNSIVLKAENISKTFISGNERLEVLKGIDLEVNSGEWICILGPSGSGKSTLLHILGGLDTSDTGYVKLDNTNLMEIDQDKVFEVRNRTIGFIFQFHHLLPEFNVLENVALPLLIGGVDKNTAFDCAQKVLAEINFLERIKARATELSGGEKQKVALARALVTNPLIILADEPTGNLDAISTNMLLELFQKLNQEKKITILTVTHNPKVAEFANRRLWLKDGKLWPVN
ncbi:MAG: ABC transporter ATP-binding protein [candidate division WOR-3 bacterium]|nr:ABC transporter ATP-binding protein [candidate division WOR-3 bacterium]